LIDQLLEERRARRRQRILQNSEQRLTTILSGPDGEEKRQAPSIEGFLGNEENAQKNGVDGEASNIAAANSNDRVINENNQIPNSSTLLHFIGSHPIRASALQRSGRAATLLADDLAGHGLPRGRPIGLAGLRSAHVHGDVRRWRADQSHSATENVRPFFFGRR
jgi:hypothetical protein